MKAVLVIDMPKSCVNCPCSGEEFGMCQAVDNEMVCDYYNIPSWCPLIPLPEKKNTNKLQIFGTSQILWTDREIYQNEGYNMCIDEITGETK